MATISKKPADIKQSDFISGQKTVFGTCKYCLQGAMIQVPESYDKSSTDEAVTRACNCDRAKIERKKEEMLNSASYNLHCLLNNKQDIHDETIEAMKECIKLIVDGEMAKATFTVASTKVDMKLKKENIHIKVTETKSETIEA